MATHVRTVRTAPGPLPRAVVRHARWAALAAAAGVVAHLAMATAGGWMALLAIAMACVCAPCAWAMLRSPSVRAARMLVGMSLGMALLHSALILGAVPMAGHAHGPVPATVGSRIDSSAHDGPALAAVGADFAASLLAGSWLGRAARSR
jgi:hypothetical protein